MRQIADTVIALVAEVPLLHGPERPADLRSASISGARAERELGWRAQTSFAEGVRRYLDWLAPTSGCTDGHERRLACIAGSAAHAVARHEPAEL